MSRRLPLLALVALLTATAAPARATFVSDVSITGGFGTVVDEDVHQNAREFLTRDGGRHFARLRLPGGPGATAKMLANGLGYAAGLDRRLWRTGDGGRTWRRTPLHGVLRVDLIAATSTGAWVVHEDAHAARLSRSEDGGRHWRTTRLRVSDPELAAARVAFADAADGVLTGLRPEHHDRRDGPAFLRITRNGGRTWTARRQPCAPDVVGYKAPAVPEWFAGGALVVRCFGSGPAASSEVHVSFDGARTFRLLSRVPPRGTPPGTGRSRSLSACELAALPPDARRSLTADAFGAGLPHGSRPRPRRYLGLPDVADNIDFEDDGRVGYFGLGGYGLWRRPFPGAVWRRVRLRSPG